MSNTLVFWARLRRRAAQSETRVSQEVAGQVMLRENHVPDCETEAKQGHAHPTSHPARLFKPPHSKAKQRDVTHTIDVM